MSILLATKLYQPPVLANRVLRAHLITKLDQGLNTGRQLTLVSAPAGFGKTTCISQWIDQLTTWPVAWLSLDNSDDDPAHFFPYFLAALQGIDQNLGRELQGVLNAGQVPPQDVISSTLINAILASQQRFLLVLDDFQVIQDRFILQVIEKLLANPLPKLHLVLLTREDPALPLARFRAHDCMTEIRAGDLRFSEYETASFLNEKMGLSLSNTDIVALENRTEGWVVGLQLAGLSIRNRADPSAFIARLNGSHRHILSYLTEEVLNGQPAEVQDFLLQTALLERMNGDLCNAVTGRADSNDMLERLFRANLFLVPLDDEQHWYRYHHLFADLLRDRIQTSQANKTLEIHRRASRWFTQAGMVNEAIRHALDAGDYEMALSLIENHAVEMLIQGYAKTVEAWLAAIPIEGFFQSPKTNLAFAWMYLLQGNPARVFPFVEHLQVIFASDNTASPSIKAEWLALQAYLLGAQGKPVESLALAKQSLEIAPETDAFVRSLAYQAMGTAYALNDDYRQALEVYQKAILHGRAARNLISEMLGIAILTQLTLQHGHCRSAFEAASLGMQRTESAGIQSPVCAAFYGGLGQIYFHWFQLEKMHVYFQRAVQLSALVGYSDAEIGYLVTTSRLLLLQGEVAEAAREIQKANDLLRVDAPAWTREDVIYQQVRVSLATNNPGEAELALGEVFQEPAALKSVPEKMSFSTRLLYNSALRIQLYWAGARQELDELHQGIQLADALISGAIQGQYLTITVEALLLRAQLYSALDDIPASRIDVARAVELAEPEGLISIFLEEGQVVASGLVDLLQQSHLAARQKEYLEKILAAFPDRRPQRMETPPTPEPSSQFTLIQPLSARELEILRLICTGCSNLEIAEKLVLSPHTVKKHTSNVFAKLGVKSRTQAVAQARQLNLL